MSDAKPVDIVRPEAPRSTLIPNERPRHDGPTPVQIKAIVDPGRTPKGVRAIVVLDKERVIAALQSAAAALRHRADAENWREPGNPKYEDAAIVESLIPLIREDGRA